jgi:hypothetical protein
VGGPSSFSISPQPGFVPTSVSIPYGYHQYLQSNQKLPFLATLDLPDMSRLTNDPIQHAPFWPPIPTKLPSEIPKFNQKPGEDPNNHVMNFHLWCSSNSLMDDSIHLRIFQRTLTCATTKWYIELLCKSSVNFNSLSMEFMMHFQFPIWYDIDKDIFTSLQQSYSTHISNHIHEWRRWRWLIKDPIPDQLLVDLFTMSLLPLITHDVSMGNIVIEE